jgi:hypothetical protein
MKRCLYATMLVLIGVVAMLLAGVQQQVGAQDESTSPFGLACPQNPTFLCPPGCSPAGEPRQGRCCKQVSAQGLSGCCEYTMAMLQRCYPNGDTTKPPCTRGPCLAVAWGGPCGTPVAGTADLNLTCDTDPCSSTYASCI